MAPSPAPLRFDSPPPARSEVDIGAAEVDFYRRNGYLVVEQVSTADEIEWLRDVYDALIARPRSGFLDGVFDLTRPYGTTDAPSVGQLLFPEKWVPAVRETAMWKNAQRIATRLLEGAAGELQHWGHIIFKAAYTGAETPWHQDEAYWDCRLRYHAAGTWMPLTDVDERNGCLWFLPGSHLRGVLAHRHLGDDAAVHILEVLDPVDTTSAVSVPLRAGGMSFHHPRTLHFAGRNRTDSIRRAWANEFQTAPIERETPANHPWVKAGAKALAASLASTSRSQR